MRAHHRVGAHGRNAPRALQRTARYLACDFRNARLGLATVFPLRFPTFISECGLGGMAIIRLIVASRRVAASFSLY
jgi:hypothetical protein